MAATDTRKAVVGDNSEVELQLRLLNENVAHLAELLQELVLATTRSEQVTVPPPLVLEQCPDGQHDWVQQSYTLRPDGTLTDQKQVICKNCGRHATYADRVGVTDDG